VKRARPIPYFEVGQRVVCVDASQNRRHAEKLLTRGKIYTIRAIDVRPGWAAPGWGVHLDGIWVLHPDDGREWPMKPERFRPVTERPTNIDVFRKLLLPAPSWQKAAVHDPDPPRHRLRRRPCPRARVVTAAIGV
jgi:hypothetical protein